MIHHAPHCNSRFSSTCGDSQWCDCGANSVREVLIWAERNLGNLVTEDEGNGAFIRGTGVELAGFGAGMTKLRKVLQASKEDR